MTLKEWRERMQNIAFNLRHIQNVLNGAIGDVPDDLRSKLLYERENWQDAADRLRRKYPTLIAIK